MFVNSSNKKATFISQIFNRNGTQQEYTPVLDELTTAANSISIDPIFVPAAQITKSLLEFNFNEFFSPLTNKIIVVTIMGEEASITNTDVFKAIVKAYKDFGNTGNSGVGVMVISKPTNSSIQSGKILAYSAANELHQTFGYSIINRNFKIPSGFNLKEITLGYSTNGTSSSSKFKIKIAISRKAVSNYNVFIEGGALYNGIWGGSKLLAVKI